MRWSKRPATEAWVYAVQGSSDDSEAPVKFGFAKNVRARVATLQTGNPQELKLLSATPSQRELERAIHDFLRPDHVRGEWFRGPLVAVALAKLDALEAWLWEHYLETKSLRSFREFEHETGWHYRDAKGEVVRTRKAGPGEMFEAPPKRRSLEQCIAANARAHRPSFGLYEPPRAPRERRCGGFIYVGGEIVGRYEES